MSEMPDRLKLDEIFLKIEENINAREKALADQKLEMARELQALRSIFVTVDKLIDAQTLDAMKKAAQAAGLGFESWIIETLIGRDVTASGDSDRRDGIYASTNIGGIPP